MYLIKVNICITGAAEMFENWQMNTNEVLEDLTEYDQPEYFLDDCLERARDMQDGR